MTSRPGLMGHSEHDMLNVEAHKKDLAILLASDEPERHAVSIELHRSWIRMLEESTPSENASVGASEA